MQSVSASKGVFTELEQKFNNLCGNVKDQNRQGYLEKKFKNGAGEIRFSDLRLYYKDSHQDMVLAQYRNKD